MRQSQEWEWVTARGPLWRKTVSWVKADNGEGDCHAGSDIYVDYVLFAQVSGTEALLRGKCSTVPEIKRFI